ncbi:MAG: hypothetical protein ACRCYQ_03910 [Nocardioides sp.]
MTRYPLGPLLEPDPSPDQARELLRRELAKPEYNDRSVLDRIAEWILGDLDLDGPTGPGVTLPSAIAAGLIFVLLLASIAFIASRTRRTRSTRSRDREVFGETGVSAAEYRARMNRAWAAGDFDAVVVDGYRAVAAGAIESGSIDDIPAATARELAVAMSAVVSAAEAGRGDRLAAAARLFDEVRYGGLAAGQAQAHGILDLVAASLGTRSRAEK